MNFTFYGHSCFLVEDQGHRLLFDPFISGNPLAAAVDVSAIQADVVLLSHGHDDHVADAESLLKRNGALLVSNYEITTWYQKRGVEKVHGMNIGGSYAFPFGRVKMVAALHSSSMPDGSYGGQPAGFVVQMGTRTFYYAGDTALTLDMKLIGDQHDLDFAVLPIGDNFTMGAVDAALAAVYCGAPKAVGVHWDTFPPIVINREAAYKAFDVMDVELLLPEIGETLTF